MAGRLGRRDFLSRLAVLVLTAWIAGPAWIVATPLAAYLLAANGFDWRLLLGAAGVAGYVAVILMVLFAVVGFVSVAARRLHDMGLSGWWVLLPLLAQAVPAMLGFEARWILWSATAVWLGSLLLLSTVRSQPRDNAYGVYPAPDPLDTSDGAVRPTDFD